MSDIQSAKRAIARAKAILGEGSSDQLTSPTDAFDALVSEARAYLASAQVADDVSIKITFSKDDFETSFERS